MFEFCIVLLILYNMANKNNKLLLTSLGASCVQVIKAMVDFGFQIAVSSIQDLWTDCFNHFDLITYVGSLFYFTY